jgi:hypothetical protein
MHRKLSLKKPLLKWPFESEKIKLMAKSKRLISAEKFSAIVRFVRGERVMMDNELAILYGIDLAKFRRTVKSNPRLFPKEFVFQLTQKEFDLLITLPQETKGRKILPSMLTEQGIAMLSVVFTDPHHQAITTDILRAFIETRRPIVAPESLFLRVEKLESDYKNILLDALAKMAAFQEHAESAKTQNNSIGFSLN